MASLSIENVSVSFQSVKALDCVSFDVPHGEICFLMGPSGCGKTTALRVVAGLQAPDSGIVRFDGNDGTALPIRERGVGMVFQSYCLWPHKTVEENISFGLEIKRLGSAEIDDRVRDILRLTDLSHHRHKFPHQLSGGQQQRVALSRALVLRPRILLLDEPFSNLDSALRASIRGELSLARDRFDLTMIFVTHEFEESMNLGSRVLFLERGKVIRSGTPGEIFLDPGSRSVAELTGGVVPVPRAFSESEIFARPEAFFLRSEGGIPGSVEKSVFEQSGARVRVKVEGTGEALTIAVPKGSDVPDAGKRIFIGARTDLFFRLPT